MISVVSSSGLEVRVERPPTIVHVVGDSHVQIFEAMLFRTASRSYVGITDFFFEMRASDVTDSAGNLHPKIAQRFVTRPMFLSEDDGQGGLRVTGVPQKYRFRPFLFSFGDNDLRHRFTKELARYDFVLPSVAHNPTFAPDPERSLVPYERLVTYARELLEPMLRGVTLLRQIGFERLSIHGIAPPTTDDELYARVNGYRVPTSVRYKCTMLFNEVLCSACAELGFPFISVWDAVAPTGFLDPRFSLDGTHLNALAMPVTITRLIEAFGLERDPDLPNMH